MPRKLGINKINIGNECEEYYKLAQNERDLVKQDFYLMRVYNNVAVASGRVSDFYSSNKFSLSEDTQTKESNSDSDMFLFNIKIKKLLDKIDKESNDMYDKSICVKYVLIYLIISNTITFINSDIIKRVKDEMNELKIAIDEVLFKNGLAITMLPKRIYKVLLYNSDVIYTRVRKSIEFVKSNIEWSDNEE